ncbi:hypothetical protein V5P93_000888 [Actinokineospora auranticolor]|uniref:hypothetical protein n=1 Tax=Actinokineospora auranticolor TaxID=155976 RepID=UPI0015E315E7|nr:hypothetical protein [Actinokineospora auranticolor]
MLAAIAVTLIGVSMVFTIVDDADSSRRDWTGAIGGLSLFMAAQAHEGEKNHAKRKNH